MQRFSLAEARALLPRVIPILEQLRACARQLRAAQTTVESAARGASADGALVADPWGRPAARRRAEEEAERAIAQLKAWGVEVKDPEQGLIDFYHERNGEIVYLCFLLGEPDIAYWHTLTGGFAGRRPV